MSLAEPGCPASFVHHGALADHERVKGDQRGQLAGRDHRVGAFEAPPERGRTGFSRLSERAGVEAAAACQPDVLLAIKERHDLIGWNRQFRRFRAGADRLLHHRGDELRLQRGAERFPQSIGDRMFMDVPQSRDVGVVTRCDGNRVTDGEVVKLPLRAQVTFRFLRLAQARQLQMKRAAVIAGEFMLGDEGDERFLG